MLALRGRLEPKGQGEGMTPGIFKMSMQEYLLLAALSSSRCHTLLTYSPFHAKHTPDDDPSEASEIGVAIHDCLLEGVDRIVTIEADDWRTKAAKEARDEARAAGKIPMLARKVPQVEAAVAAAKAYVAGSELAGVFDSGHPELSMIWKEGNIFCKARPDWLGEGWCVHVKTTQGSAEPSAWIRNMLTPMGYDISAVLYERGIKSALQVIRPSVFLVIEANPPYGCSLVALDPAMQDLASRKVERAIRVWQQCQASGQYPCYPSRICYAEPKPWQIADEEMADENDAFDQLQHEHGIEP